MGKGHKAELTPSLSYFSSHHHLKQLFSSPLPKQPRNKEAKGSCLPK